jgi:hypothetical protein
VLFMLRALCLTLAVLVVPPGHASADTGTGLGANAALKYWQAFAQLPKLPDAEGQKLNAEYLTMPLDAHTREIVTKAAYALRMMYQGAALPRCDWAIGWEEEGIDALLPQMNAARVLSSVACLRARLRFEEGRNREGIDDLLAALTLGRHVSLDGSLIGVLVGYSIENRINDALALYLPKLDAGTIKDLKKRLDALPAGGRPATGLRTCEEKTLDWFARKVKEAKDKDSLPTLLSPLFLTEGKGKQRDLLEQGRAFLAACGGTREGVLKFVEETRPCYALVAKQLELPVDQFEREFEREKQKRAGNPVFQAFFPAILNVRRAQARADVRHALLAAALAVQLDGRDALKNHPDPVMGGPFEYVPFAGGFELRSELKGQGDKPVALTVGRRGS